MRLQSQILCAHPAALRDPRPHRRAVRIELPARGRNPTPAPHRAARYRPAHRRGRLRQNHRVPPCAAMSPPPCTRACTACATSPSPPGTCSTCTSPSAGSSGQRLPPSVRAPSAYRAIRTETPHPSLRPCTSPGRAPPPHRPRPLKQLHRPHHPIAKRSTCATTSPKTSGSQHQLPSWTASVRQRLCLLPRRSQQLSVHLLDRAPRRTWRHGRARIDDVSQPHSSCATTSLRALASTAQSSTRSPRPPAHGHPPLVGFTQRPGGRWTGAGS